ncbi:MAG: S-adenosylmethionine:tRNA ribosyltransferase-isomerase [Bacteroidaceae bacterium]|nr:S-adenosylmethionine:tRNA ribosyltransferase-isomerase [Bacteroidaceae bacterium]
MMEPKHIQIKDYNYPLPEERIAKFPLAQRDKSKLLVYRHGDISQDTFCHLPEYLPKGALMIFNNTRVVRARLHFRKSTAPYSDGQRNTMQEPSQHDAMGIASGGTSTKSQGALIEIFILEPALPVEYQENFLSRGRCSWYCLVGNLKKWKTGSLHQQIQIGEETVTLSATRGETHGTSHQIDFTWDTDHTWAEILEATGELPIPPYLNRKTEQSDLTTYQTVYSKVKGSVAAPTAGLHFTPEVLAELDSHGIEREEVTLHVGAGTFKPVKSEEIGDHDMHTEHIAVNRTTIERLIAHGGSAIAVGTTSVRTLESLYYMGLLAMQGKEDLHVEQWMPYAEHAEALPDTCQALQALLKYMDERALDILHSSTQIIIAPGYKFHIVKMMVTNFHQPQSTLLLLVSAFVQGNWRSIYDYALENDFRFLSYGDSSLLIPETTQELLPLVDPAGNVIGKATRTECHNGSMLLHPVVHLHVFNSKGELYLQKRPMWKDIQPGKWDTAVGGHVDFGEDIPTALLRETREELGINAEGCDLMQMYEFHSDREHELIYAYKIVYDKDITPSEETDGGRFWSLQEIQDAIGQGILTPNFEMEFSKLFGREK